MASDLNADWVSTVRSVCDPIFDTADVGFAAQIMMRDDNADAMLWEADPDRFAARYPDSGIVESYGPGWPPPCLDFWAYIKTDSRRAVLHPDGWGGHEIVVELSGDAGRDGLAIAREFARILHVAEPTP